MNKYRVGWDDDRWERIPPLESVEAATDTEAALDWMTRQGVKVKNGEIVRVYVTPTTLASDGYYLEFTAMVMLLPRPRTGSRNR